MKRSVGLWQLMGFGVTALGGTVLHFLYDWLDHAVWIAPFSGVNESTWEHMKLLFWPMFIYAIFQSFFFKSYNNFWCVKLYGILLGLVFIPILFYTYNGVIGKSPDWLNILIFFICDAIAYAVEVKLLYFKKIHCKLKKFAVLLLTVLSFLFVLFTFLTPEIGIFVDPLTDTYGIMKY